MSKSRTLVCLWLTTIVFSCLSYGVTPDRISGSLTGGPAVAIKGNVHGLAKPEFDLGRADGSRLVQGLVLSFRPSALQQKDLDRFISQLQDRTSRNYHKYLTPTQFADRFGMSQNDINKIVSWLLSEGFKNISVANGRNEIFFDGTVAQIESAFRAEMHNYRVNGEVHLANATDPLVPEALAGTVLAIGHLNDFAPKPRAKVRPNLTSYVSGDHFITPGDFATIYDLGPLYSAGIDGAGQKIAIVGQSTVSTTDLNNFRSAAGLPPSTVTMTLAAGTAAQCSGDEGESDLDLEWSGGIAQKASIIFVYAGLGTGESCARRNTNVWDALDYAVQHNVAPFISISYGFCETGLGAAFGGANGVVENWAKQAVTQGQTIVAAAGDSGAADCESSGSTSATTGLAVDVPASIPEVTGAGGTGFSADSATCTTACPPGADPPYWSAAGANADTISSALEYIPEAAWNDTAFDIAHQGGLSASGGGASAIGFFTKPSWQSGAGVPADGQRDVPDVSLSASADHDGYLFCSEDSTNGASSCSSGFRAGAGGNFTIVGGTSMVAPTFSAILALVNQYVGNVPPTGLAPINPTLYQLPGNNPAPFHDITTGNNKVPCTSGSTDCPAGTTQIGFSAGAGYDQVTGLGSVDSYNLAQVWRRAPTTVSISSSSSNINLGGNVTFTATVAPSTTTGTVNFYNNGSSTALGSADLAGGTATFSTTALPLGTNNVTATYTGGPSSRFSSSPTSAVVTTGTSFSLTSNLSGATLSVVQGQTSGAVNLTVTSSTGFVITSGSSSSTALPVSYTCSNLPSEALCNFSPGTPSSSTSITLTISTRAPITELRRPLDRTGIFYALLLPGLMGIVFTVRSRKGSLGTMRVLGLIVVLGFSTLWTASCGGTSGSGNKDPGTPAGTYTINVNAATSGSSPITASPVLTLQLAVTP